MIQGDIINNTDNIIELSKQKKVDFIMATPPCQSFSNAGRKEISDNRTCLFLPLIQIIKEILPKYVLIENVPSFIQSRYLQDNEDTVINKFNTELNSMYNIKWDILNTKDFGVPQSRQRAIILMSRHNMNIWEFPNKINKYITVRDAIGHLPNLESEEISDIHKWHKAKKHNERHILWMSHTPTGKSAFDNKIHYPQKDGRKIKGYKTTYKRIEWDKPSPTITMCSGSISSQNNVHPGNIKKDGTYDNARVLSVYELILLTGLDDNWDPPTTQEKIVRDILGEAVPPLLINKLILNIP